jgi:hypothetical protein
MEPESSIPYSQDPATCPNMSQINPVHSLPAYFRTLRGVQINSVRIQILLLQPHVKHLTVNAVT